jgi:hypothetical protein
MIVVGLTVSAYAQGRFGDMPGARGHRGHQHRTEQPKRKVDDEAYKAALDKLPDKKFDPWQNVRQGPQAK